MSTIRIMLCMLVSFGLVLTPVQAAVRMPDAPHTSIVAAAEKAGVSTDQDCACCKPASQCSMATCAMHCVQIGPILTSANTSAAIGHAPFASLLPALNDGIGWRPPAPPPRV